MRLIACIIVLFFHCFRVDGNGGAVITVSNPNTPLNIGNKIWLYEDRYHTLTINNLLTHPELQQDFKQSNQLMPNFSMTSSAVWCSFTLHNQTTEDLYLKLNNPRLDTIDFYAVSDSSMGAYTHMKTGMMLPYEKRIFETPAYLFALNIAPNQSKTFYLKVRSSSPIQLPLTVGSLATFWRQSHRADLIQGIYMGFIIVVMVYQLYLWFTTREKLFLYYAFYSFLSGVNNIDHKGYAMELLWRNVYWVNNFQATMAALIGFFAVQLTMALLHTKKNAPMMHRGLQVFLVCIVVVIICNLLGWYLISGIMSQALITSGAAFIIIGSFILWGRGLTRVRFFLLGWLVYMVVAILFVLRDANILPYNILTANMLQIGSAFQLIFFMLALADKTAEYKREKEKSQQENELMQQQIIAVYKEKERLVREQNAMLEIAVNERTEKLQKALDDEKIAEERINKQRLFFESVLNSLPLEISVLNKDKQVAFRNTLAHKNSSLPRFHLPSSVSLATIASIPPHHLQASGLIAENSLNQALQLQKQTQTEAIVIQPNGRIKVWSVSYLPMYQMTTSAQTTGKELAMVICYGIDITQRKLSEEVDKLKNEQIILFKNEQLQLSKTVAEDFDQSLHTILESGARVLNCERVSFWQAENNGTSLVCTGQYLLSLKTAANECAGMELTQTKCPLLFEALSTESAPLAIDNAAQHQLSIQLYAANILPPLPIGALLYVPIWKEGVLQGVITIEHTANSRQWTAEEIQFCSSLAEYVSLAKETYKRKQTEKALNRQRLFYENIINSLPISIEVYSPHKLLTFANKTAMPNEELRQSALGKPILTYYQLRNQTEADAHAKARHLQNAIDMRRLIEVEESDCESEESKHCNLVVYIPIFDENGKLHMIINYTLDITELKRREHQLKTYSIELERSNKDLQQFAYIASHDLKSPLRTIVSFVQLLEYRYDKLFDQTAKEYLAYVVDGGKRMVHLIDDLLLYSRINQNLDKPDAVNLQAIMDMVKADLRALITEKKVVLSYVNLPVIPRTHQSLLLHLLSNLVSNGIKFNQNEQPHISVSATENASEFIISVTDNGIGIEPEYANKIFTMFKRLHSHEEYEGTGIGLAICKKIVEFYGGKIWLESEPGKGSRFYFSLPK